MEEGQKIIKSLENDLKSTVDYTIKEFNAIHTGKASPSMVENLFVEAYGSRVSLKEVAAITTPDARMIVIQPWDKGILQNVEKSIIVANIGLSPIIDGHIIRCPIPELSRERRKELVKTTEGIAEQGRVRVRDNRRKAMDKIKVLGVSDDDKKRLEKVVQEKINEYIANINKSLELKEKELIQI